MAAASNYGITAEEYQRRLREQGGGCAICGDECPSGARLSVDYNHVTGEVRGLLCKPCNMALGGFKDDVLIIKKAINYLEAS